MLNIRPWPAWTNSRKRFVTASFGTPPSGMMPRLQTISSSATKWTWSMPWMKRPFLDPLDPKKQWRKNVGAGQRKCKTFQCHWLSGTGPRIPGRQGALQHWPAGDWICYPLEKKHGSCQGCSTVSFRSCQSSPCNPWGFSCETRKKKSISPATRSTPNTLNCSIAKNPEKSHVNFFTAKVWSPYSLYRSFRVVHAWLDGIANIVYII